MRQETESLWKQFIYNVESVQAYLHKTVAKSEVFAEVFEPAHDSRHTDLNSQEVSSYK